MTTTEPVRLPETPDVNGAFPRLSDPWLQTLAAHGRRRPVQPGDVLYREGDECRDFRRSMLLELGAGFRIIGSRYSPDTRRLREFAARNRLPHRWIDLEWDKEAEALLRELARAIGLPAPSPGMDRFDLVIVGAGPGRAGPAGLAAAVYAASEGLTTVTLDGVATGGQAGTASRIENYPGFLRGSPARS